MTFVGVQGTGRVIAERGQPMSSSTSFTAARAFVRRSHRCDRRQHINREVLICLLPVHCTFVHIYVTSPAALRERLQWSRNLS